MLSLYCKPTDNREHFIFTMFASQDNCEHLSPRTCSLDILTLWISRKYVVEKWPMITKSWKVIAAKIKRFENNFGYSKPNSMKLKLLLNSLTDGVGNPSVYASWANNQNIQHANKWNPVFYTNLVCFNCLYHCWRLLFLLY